MVQSLAYEVAQKLTDNAALWLLSFASVLALACLRLASNKLHQFIDFCKSRQRALAAVARRKTASGWQEGPGVWTFRPIIQPENYRRNVKSAHIVAVVNLKGGVGKTTIAANVAAYLAHHDDWKKRILLIDLDYQGSLSSMAFPNDISWIPAPGTDSVATRALGGEIEPNLFLQTCKHVSQEPRLRVATAYYDLAQADNRLLIEWLLNVRKPSKLTWHTWFARLFTGKIYQAAEMRYNLATLLHSQAVQDAFDLVIIDCPPRLTAGTIQALCASSHVLIPTILDKPSGESVSSFCEQLNLMQRANLCPYLKYVGIVATRFNGQLRSNDANITWVEDLIRSRGHRCGFLPPATFIPQTVKLVRSTEDGIAYFGLPNDRSTSSVRKAIGALSRHIAHAVGISPAREFDDNGYDPDDPLQLLLPVAAE
jgi:chromosome partitioning protein